MCGRENAWQRANTTRPEGPWVSSFSCCCRYWSRHRKHSVSKGKKRARKQQEEQSDSDGHATSQHERANGESLPEECDEAAWRLDEAQEDLAGEADQTSRSNSPGFPGEATTLADDIMRTHRSEELPIPGGRLELPASPSADAEGSNSWVRQSLRPAPRRCRDRPANVPRLHR